MLMTMGQLVPCIGHRPAGQNVVLYAGQRRLLAARASHELAGDGLQPVRSLIVSAARPRPLAGRDPPHPGPGEPARGPHARRPAGPVRRLLGRPRRPARQPTGSPPSAPTSASAPVKAHNLRRQLTLPEPIRTRVAERPGERQLSVTLANRLADMHESRPSSPQAVAQRISTPDLHDAALRDLGAFVHRTLVEDETRLRRPHRRRRPARRAHPAHARPRSTSTDAGRAPGRRRARLRARRARQRTRRAADQGQAHARRAARRRRAARARPHRPLRLRPRPRPRLRRRHLGRRPRVHARRRPPGARRRATTPPGQRPGVLRRRRARRARPARRRRRTSASAATSSASATPTPCAPTSGSATTCAPA